MRETRDPTLLNYAVNQPETLSVIAPPYDRLDLSEFFERPMNRAFGDERGVILFGYRGDGVYEVHYLMLPRHRGKVAMRAIQDAFETMFTRHHASAMVGDVPRENRASRAMCRALGCLPVGTGTDRYSRPTISYRLDRATWATLSAESSAESAPLSAATKRPTRSARVPNKP